MDIDIAKIVETASKLTVGNGFSVTIKTNPKNKFGFANADLLITQALLANCEAFGFRPVISRDSVRGLVFISRDNGDAKILTLHVKS